MEANPKNEGTFAVIAALIVLFSAMWDPWISIGVAIGALIMYAIYKFTQK